MLVGDFCQVIAQDGLRFTVRLNAAHPIYKAHFPDMPVTPGACLVQIAEELTGRKIERITNLKFMKPVPSTAEITYTFTPRKEQEYQVVITDKEDTYARFVVTYMRPDTDL